MDWIENEVSHWTNNYRTSISENPSDDMCNNSSLNPYVTTCHLIRGGQSKSSLLPVIAQVEAQTGQRLHIIQFLWQKHCDKTPLSSRWTTANITSSRTHDLRNTQNVLLQFSSSGKLSYTTFNTFDLLFFFSPPPLPKETADFPNQLHISKFKAKQTKLLK